MQRRVQVSVLSVLAAFGLLVGTAASSAPQPVPSFSAAKSYSLFPAAPSVVPDPPVVADVSGDGRPDLLTTRYGVSKLSVLVNRGDGRFRQRVGYVTGAHPSALRLADLNGDRRPDVVTVNATSLSVLANAGAGTFAPRHDYPVAKGTSDAAVVDLNRDGAPDVVLANSTRSTVSVLLNTGDGTLATAVEYQVGKEPESLAAGDLDGDGKPELVTADYKAGAVSVLLNDGHGGFATARKYTVDRFPYPVVLRDLDGDGDLDLVVRSPAASVSILLNRGNGSFGETRRESVESMELFDVVDVNGDRRPDLVSAMWGATAEYWTVSIDLNRGDGTFRGGPAVHVGDEPDAGAMADLNGDGQPELVITRDRGPAGPVVSVHVNRGGGRFGPKIDYPARGVDNVGVGDLDGDGRTDVVTSGRAGKTTQASVLMNRAGLCNVQEVEDDYSKSLADARKKLTRGNCRVGRVRYVHERYWKGHVLSQKPAFGAVLPRGGKVDLVVSRGPKR
jgi:hypothetical protein